jgi:hypothetical protein
MDDEIIRRFANKQCALLTFETVDTATPGDETTTLNYTATTDLDGTTTPVKQTLKVTSSKDSQNPASGVTSMLVMGLAATDSSTPGAGVPLATTISMPALKNTETSRNYFWVRYYGMRPAGAGSEGDAAGTITFTSGTTKYASVSAAGCMSTVGHFYVPAGWAACCFRADYSQNQVLLASNSPHAVYVVRYHKFIDEYYNSAGAAVNITRDKFSFGMENCSGTVRLRQIPLRANRSTSSSYITFHGDLITGTLTGSVKFYVLMVKL